MAAKAYTYRMNSTSYWIALVLCGHLVKKNPCELSQHQIMEGLRSFFDLEISRSTLNHNLAILRRQGYLETERKRGSRTTVYKMTEKLHAFFEKEYREFAELEKMMSEESNGVDEQKIPDPPF